MKKFLSVIVALSSLAACTATAMAQVSLDSCQVAARANYPAVRQLALLESTRNIELSNINRAWLPRISLFAQSTVQNAVPQFPEVLSNMLDQLGTRMDGISPWQYRAGMEVTQTLWDGGASAAQRALCSASAQVQTSLKEVELYTLRERVENLFFALLLLDEQTKQIEAAKSLIESKLEQVNTLISNGAALSSDSDMLQAQALSLGQQIMQAKSARQGYLNMLQLLTAIPLEGKTLQTPPLVAAQPSTTLSARPEMELFEARMRANRAAVKASDVALRPKFALFGQTFYGNPGLDNFASMMSHKGSFNAIGGVRASWNLDAFYTNANQRQKLRLEQTSIEADRETFLLNQSILTASQKQTIKGLKDLQESDERILQLRTNIRRSAEAQFQNGTLDLPTLLSKINDETTAALNAQYHRLQLIREIYRIKYITNQ